MIRDTVAPARNNVHLLREDVTRWRRMLGISQNEYARRCGVDPSILSRFLNGKLTSSIAERSIRQYNTRLQRRLEKVS